MNSFKRKLIWITLLIAVVAGISFLCFCLIPLEQQKEDNAKLMLEEGGKHEDHQYFGEDDPLCPGCHSFMWRFNTRFRENEELMDKAKENEKREQQRKERVEQKNKK